MLLQDPHNLERVFAGTTEGLFRSEDAGKTWNRTTGPEVIVNDVSVDLSDPKHVLLATDRGGVMASDDGGDTFHSSNGGFSARQITTLKRDANHPTTLFVGVVNDKDWGGVFQSDNGGSNWIQRSEGLQGRDVFSLGQAPDGTMIAGTAHGLYRLDGVGVWQRVENAPAGLPIPASPRTMPNLTRPPVPIAHSSAAPRRPFRPVSAAQRKFAPPHGQHKPASRISTTATRKQLQAARKHGSAKVPATIAGKTKYRAAVQTSLTAPALVVADSASPGASSASFDGSVYGMVTTGRCRARGNLHRTALKRRRWCFLEDCGSSRQF